MVVVLANLTAMSRNMSLGKMQSRIQLRQQGSFSLCVAWTVGVKGTSSSAFPLQQMNWHCLCFGLWWGLMQEPRGWWEAGRWARDPQSAGSGEQGRAWLVQGQTSRLLTDPLPLILLASGIVLPFHYLHSFIPSFLHSKFGCLLPVRHCARHCAGPKTNKTQASPSGKELS